MKGKIRILNPSTFHPQTKTLESGKQIIFYHHDKTIYNLLRRTING